MPERFNIAPEVCDKHPRDKLAMIHEHFEGDVREITWGELQDLAGQAANALEAAGVERGDRVAVVLPRRRRPRRSSSAPGSSARCCCPCPCSTATTASSTASTTPGRTWSSPTRRTRDASTTTTDRHHRGLPRRPPDRLRDLRHVGRRPGAALLHLGHHGRGQGRRARAPLRPRATRSSSTATTSRRASSSTAWASGRGPPASRRCSARGATARSSASSSARAASTPRAAGLPVAPQGHQRLHDADRDALDDGDQGRGQDVPVRVPQRVLGGRAAQPRGDQVVPRAVRASPCSTTTG